MLILTIRSGEMITIGDDIKIWVCGVKGDKVKIGIEAPVETDIGRPDMKLSTKKANKAT